MTIRNLASFPGQNYNLAQWMEFATRIGLSVTPDEELSREAALLIKDRLADMPRILKGPSSNAYQHENGADETDAKKREAAERRFEKLVRENYVFLDITSLLFHTAPQALSRMIPILRENRKMVYMPYSAVEELQVGASDDNNVEMRDICRDRAIILKSMYDAQLLQFRDSQSLSDNASDSVARDIHILCAHFRLQNQLLVITQNEDLARDLLSLNRQKSANGNNIIVKRFNKYGFLSNVFDSQTDKEKNHSKEAGNSRASISSRPFRICDKVREGSDQLIPISIFPRVNDTVYDPAHGNAPILLTEELGSGGEGTIYRTNTPYVAKVYNPDCCTIYRYEKIQKMVRAKLDYQRGICFPIAVLFNREGRFIGYLMPEAKGYSLQNSIFRKMLFQRKLPGWKKADLVQCAITILYQIKYLHDNNIIIGDINPNNFLVVSPKEVYLVDTDSFQLDDLPCPVGSPMFTAPEIHFRQRQGQFSEYSQIMRTKPEEYFAVATLMFMLMLPGKPPYTQQDGGDIVENILGMHFPYALGGERHGENVPDGAWRYIWSHLTYDIKKDFHQVFDKTSEKSDFCIDERLSVDEWILEMSKYSSVLELWTNNADSDPESLVLYPTRFKRQRGKQYVLCRGDCGREYPEDDLVAGFCYQCRNKGTTVQCFYCGKDFIHTNYEKYFKKIEQPLLCPECRKISRQVVQSYHCAAPNCPNMVEVTVLRIAKLKAKHGDDYKLPKYCCETCKKVGQLSNRNRSSNYRSQKSPSVGNKGVTTNRPAVFSEKTNEQTSYTRAGAYNSTTSKTDNRFTQQRNPTGGEYTVRNTSSVSSSPSHGTSGSQSNSTSRSLFDRLKDWFR